MFHKIRSVAALADYKLLVHFAEGCSKIYDMMPLIQRMPVYTPLRKLHGLFEQVQIDPGGYGISWSDEIDLDGAELWENGIAAKSPFDGLLSFADASSLWGLNESTLRKAVSYRKLIEGADVQKYGKQWVVTRIAMEREYGPLHDRP